ncbi:flagellar protein FlaG [Neobacillus sp. D3-1R]|uniref:flagellar protein FlaG n=1 Tax=Neobacillus sp. D3-1R TaxID=3445778 RepID=UPI003F9F8193
MIERLSSSNLSSTMNANVTEEVKSNQNSDSTLVEAEKQKTIEQETLKFPKERVKEIVQGMNDFLEPTHTSLKFQYHEKLNEYYVTIVDDATKEVVREIPSKKLLDTYAAMTEFLGLLVDKKI